MNKNFEFGLIVFSLVLVYVSTDCESMCGDENLDNYVALVYDDYFRFCKRAESVNINKLKCMIKLREASEAHSEQNKLDETVKNCTRIMFTGWSCTNDTESSKKKLNTNICCFARIATCIKDPLKKFRPLVNEALKCNPQNLG